MQGIAVRGKYLKRNKTDRKSAAVLYGTAAFSYSTSFPLFIDGSAKCYPVRCRSPPSEFWTYQNSKFRR